MFVNQVGVRVRPLNPREIESGASEAVRVIGGKTISVNVKGLSFLIRLHTTSRVENVIIGALRPFFFRHANSSFCHPPQRKHKSGICIIHRPRECLATGIAKTFSFDHSFDPFEPQQRVYVAMASQLCADVCLGACPPLL